MLGVSAEEDSIIMKFGWKSFLLSIVTAAVIFHDVIDKTASGFLYKSLAYFITGLLVWLWGGFFHILYESDKEVAEKKREAKLDEELSNIRSDR